MVVILFRSKLTDLAGEDYAETQAQMKQHAETFEGFVDIKGYRAEDGERLTVVRWKDLETLERWRVDAKHVAAKRQGRARWYQYYNIEIANIVDSRAFVRDESNVGQASV